MVLEVGVSAVEDVADVHRFLVLPLERKTSIDFFLCLFVFLVLSREIYEEKDSAV